MSYNSFFFILLVSSDDNIGHAVPFTFLYVFLFFLHLLSFFLYIIFQSLKLLYIQAKRTSVKLDIYRKFSNALAVVVVASVAWIGYEVCALLIR